MTFAESLAAYHIIRTCTIKVFGGSGSKINNVCYISIGHKIKIFAPIAFILLKW